MAGLHSHAGHELGPYRLGERLGAGGMAEVYVARRDGPGGFSKRFAVKRILPQLARDPRFADMFCDEARICAALSHPNIVQVVDFGEHDGELFMAMEFIDGVSGARLLRSVAARGERFPIGAALFIAHEVLRALAFAHEAADEEGRSLGIVHRDVSPGNILVSLIGEVKLSDFGIVRSAFVERRTSPGELKGKMGYMSPEQAIGAEVDPRSDLFTVGIVLAEMLIARPLFPGRSELEILTRIYEADIRVLGRHGAHLPKSLMSILYRALARGRDQRFQSASEFLGAIRLFARQNGLVLDDSELSPWLADLGILSSASGMHEVSSARHLDVNPAPPAKRAHDATRRRRVPTERAARRRTPIAVAKHYHALGPNGRALGPVPLARLLELVATGRLASTASVSVDAREFAPMHSFPELASVASKTEFQFDDQVESRASWRRTIRRATLPSHLYDLIGRESTGLLVARSGSQKRRVYFVEGVPVFVASTDPTELLGRRLVAQNFVPQKTVDEVLSDPNRRVRLGEALVARGALRPAALLRAVIAQTEARLVELGTWTTGDMLFVPGERNVNSSVPSQTSSAAIVSRLINRGYGEDEVAAVLAPLRHHSIARATSPIAIRSLGLSEVQSLALGRAGGAASLEELVITLASEGACLPSDTLRAVFVGLNAGLLSMRGWPDAAEDE